MSRHLVTEAIILRTSRFGEIHKNVTLFTPTLGVLYAIAHGALKMKSKLRSSTEPFMAIRADLYHDPVKDNYKITDAETRFLPFGISQSPDRFFAASLVAEIVLRSFGGGECGNEMFHLVASALTSLDAASSADIPFIIVQFIYRYLDLTGFLLQLNSCGRCGRMFDDAMTVSFYRPSGELMCPFCTRPGVVPDEAAQRAESAADTTMSFGQPFRQKNIPVNPGARRYLVKTIDLDFRSSLGIRVDRETVAGLKQMMFDLAEGLLGGPLATIRCGEGII